MLLAMTETGLDPDAALTEMLDSVQVRPDGDRFVGVAPAWFGEPATIINCPPDSAAWPHRLVA